MRTIISTKIFIGVAVVVTVFASSAWADADLNDKAGKAGGSSAEHMSDQGKANANAPGAADRTTGQARADERRNDQGAEHNKAGDHRHGDKHDKHHKHDKKDKPPREKKH